MKKLFASVLVGLCIIGCNTDRSKYFYRAPHLPAFGKGLGLPHNYESPGILHLRMLDNTGLCTGFVIDDNYAVTAAHCVDFIKEHKVLVRDINNKPIGSATVVGYYSRGDIALLMADFSKYIPGNIMPNLALGDLIRNYPGIRFLALGFPLLQTALVSTSISSLTPVDSAFVGQGELYPGMSGGPVVVEGGNVVIGLNTATMGPDVVVSPLTGLLGIFEIEPNSEANNALVEEGNE